jgi:hypothetical protein
MGNERRDRRNRAWAVRKGDHEPFTALRWLVVLFKAAAVFLGVAVFAEFIAGMRVDGRAVLPVLLGEVARTTIIAIVLWGTGDLLRLLLQIGHDLRADRILLARLNHRTPPAPQEGWWGETGAALDLELDEGPEAAPGEAAAD